MSLINGENLSLVKQLTIVTSTHITPKLAKSQHITKTKLSQNKKKRISKTQNLMTQFTKKEKKKSLDQMQNQ